MAQWQILQVWPRRQEISQQWASTELTLIEGVEKKNAVIACLNQQTVFAPQNPYAMDINKGNRNCYNCREFGHLVLQT